MRLNQLLTFTSTNYIDFYSTIKAHMIMVLFVISTLLLSGCESPLVLEKVNAQNKQPIQRTDFYQAFASNDDVSVLVGNSGLILTSLDGQIWSRKVLDEKPSFIAIDSCPDKSFIALSFDNHIWKSSTNANTWSSIKIDSQEQLMTLDCAPNGDWWVAGGFSTLIRSSDNGHSWHSITLDEDTIITDVHFLSELEAVATAEFGMLITTNDGGLNWEIKGYMPGEFYPHAAYFTSISEGWVGGLNGFIFYTNDAGNSWQQQSVDSTAPIYQFEYIDGEIFALGDNATVLKFNGTKWVTIMHPSAPVYLRAALYFKQKLLVAGGRGMLKTIDPNIAALSVQVQE